MKKFTLYLGLNDKDSKMQKISTVESYKICMGIITRHTSGATIYEATGFYKHVDGSITIEPTLRIELMFIERNKVLEIVENLKLVFNQESVILQEQKITSEMI